MNEFDALTDPNLMGQPAVPQAPSPDRLRGLINPVLGALKGVHGTGAPMPPQAAPVPQWSAASYEPSQFANMPPAAPQQPWGGGRQMPQQNPGAPRQIPQQSSPMVRALRGQ
jgi:hypothetical protein